MDNPELRRLWTQRLRGMRAMNDRVSASRRESSTEDLLLRMDRVFVRSGNKHGKEEQKVREIWLKWRTRAAAAGLAARHS